MPRIESKDPSTVELGSVINSFRWAFASSIRMLYARSLAKTASINRQIVAIRINRFIATLIPSDDTMAGLMKKYIMSYGAQREC